MKTLAIIFVCSLVLMSCTIGQGSGKRQTQRQFIASFENIYPGHVTRIGSDYTVIIDTFTFFAYDTTTRQSRIVTYELKNWEYICGRLQELKIDHECQPAIENNRKVVYIVWENYRWLPVLKKPMEKSKHYKQQNL